MSRSGARCPKAPVVAVDFFCGAGGLTRGLLDAGIQVIAGIDSDPRMRRTYESNNSYHGVPVRFIEADVRTLSVEAVRELVEPRSAPLLLAGCPPCQPFSRMRTNKVSSANDTNLLLEFLRFVRELEPEFVLVENVVGIRRSGWVFGRFLAELKELGYFPNYGTVNAADYGVPQRRYRVFVLAARGVNVGFPAPTHTSESWLTVRHAIERFPPIRAGEVHPHIPNHEASPLSEINTKRLERTPVNGGSRASWADDPELHLQCYRGRRGYEDVYGRMAWDRPAPTLTTKFNSISNGRFGHPEQLRAISLREGAALQTFPDDYVFYGTRKHVAKQIGNAVPPKLARVFGNHIVTHVHLVVSVLREFACSSAGST